MNWRAIQDVRNDYLISEGSGGEEEPRSLREKVNGGGRGEKKRRKSNERAGGKRWVKLLY